MRNFDELKEKLKEKFQDLKHNKKLIITASIILVVVAAVFLFSNFTGDKKTEETVTVSSEQSPEQSKSRLYVDVDGAVKNPGLYEITSESRIYDVIKLAGGLLENADTASINQAEKVTDGQKIMIPFKGEQDSSQGTGSEQSNGKVNINSADAAALQQIPGIGPSKAEKIITYRQTNGRFKSIEDLKNVNGIGEKTFESIKEYITI